MKTVEIQINTINDIRDFVEMASRCKFDVDLASTRYTVNGKSIMGVASLDKSKPISVLIHSDNDEECAEFISQLKKFM